MAVCIVPIEDILRIGIKFAHIYKAYKYNIQEGLSNS